MRNFSRYIFATVQILVDTVDYGQEKLPHKLPLGVPTVRERERWGDLKRFTFCNKASPALRDVGKATRDVCSCPQLYTSVDVDDQKLNKE